MVYSSVGDSPNHLCLNWPPANNIRKQHNNISHKKHGSRTAHKPYRALQQELTIRFYNGESGQSKSGLRFIQFRVRELHPNLKFVKLASSFGFCGERKGRSVNRIASIPRSRRRSFLSSRNLDPHALILFFFYFAVLQISRDGRDGKKTPTLLGPLKRSNQ
jgi:hypothetical protein